jgi:hypothetical protein
VAQAVLWGLGRSNGEGTDSHAYVLIADNGPVTLMKDNGPKARKLKVMKTQSRSLTLHRETLHQLTTQDLSQAAACHRHGASGRTGCVTEIQACLHTRAGSTCRAQSLQLPCWPA